MVWEVLRHGTIFSYLNDPRIWGSFGLSLYFYDSFFTISSHSLIVWVCLPQIPSNLLFLIFCEVRKQIKLIRTLCKPGGNKFQVRVPMSKEVNISAWSLWCDIYPFVISILVNRRLLQPPEFVHFTPVQWTYLLRQSYNNNFLRRK